MPGFKLCLYHRCSLIIKLSISALCSSPSWFSILRIPQSDSPGFYWYVWAKSCSNYSTTLSLFTLLSKDLLRLDFLLVSIRAEIFRGEWVIMLGICFIWNFCMGFKQIDKDLPTRRVGQFCRFWALKGMQESSFSKGLVVTHSPSQVSRFHSYQGTDFKTLDRVENSFFSDSALLAIRSWASPPVCVLITEENMGFFKFCQKSPLPSLFSLFALYCW